MASYHNDQPINNDQQDKLNRTTFASSLANIAYLDEGAPCFTVSIEGHWGVGKTSILNLVSQNFKQRSIPPIVVHYNPWVNGKPKSLVEDFLVQFTSQLKLEDKPEQGLQVAKELLAYSKLFSVAKLIPGVEPFGSLVENIFKGVGETTKSLSDLKKLDVQGQKETVVNKLQYLGKPIVVIIDDIDRLTPAECFQVLRLVKAIADFPRTTFLLAFDPIYIQEVLSANNVSNASQYIDKIIQLRLPIPFFTEEDKNTLVDDALTALGSNFTFEHYTGDKERFRELYHRHLKGILTSPRDIKRAMNHFKFTYDLVKHEVSTTDLFVLSILATKYNRIYEHIKNNPFMYVGQHDGMSFWLTYNDQNDIKREAREQRNKIYNSLKLSENNPIESLLKEIFPSIDDDLQHQYFKVEDPDAAGRVDSIARLSTALHISTPRGLCSDEDVRLFIDNIEENLGVITKIIQTNTTTRFLEIFDFQIDKKTYPSEHYIKAIKILVEEFMEKGLFNSQDNLYDGLLIKSSNHTLISKLIRKLVQKEDNKLELLNNIIDNFTLIPFISSTVRTLIRQHNQSSTSSEKPWISDIEANAVLDKYTMSTEEMIIKSRISSKILEYHSILPLWQWRDEKAQEIMNNIGSDNVLRIGYLLIGEIGSSYKGNYISVNLEKSGFDINLPKLKDKAQQLLTSTENQLDRAVLLCIHDGHKHFISDGSIEDE